MKKRDLKNKITSHYKAEAPNLRSKILASCQKEKQESADTKEQEVHQADYRFLFNSSFKRLAVAAVCLLLFVSGLSVGLLIPNNSDPDTIVPTNAETFIYLDVNPSIELQVDAENKILECLAGNEDAEEILNNLNLAGVDMNTAITAIIGSMYINGFLVEDSNSILVSVDTKDESNINTLLTDISNKINTVIQKSGLECSIIAQSVTVTDEIKQRAEAKGISVGKMQLVDKMVNLMEDFGEDDTASLADMSIKELNLIYSTRPNKDGNDDPFDKDISTGSVGGFIKDNDALAMLLETIEVDASEVAWYEVKAKPTHRGEDRQMVYHISIRLNDDTKVYKFEIDCTTGQIIKSDDKIPSLNPPDSDDSHDHQTSNPGEQDTEGGNPPTHPFPDDDRGDTHQDENKGEQPHYDQMDTPPDKNGG